MAKKKTSQPKVEEAPSGISNLASVLLTEANRGLLLDVVVFLTNLFLMRLLLGYFLEVIRAASNGNEIAQLAMFLFCLSLFILPPLGATLKRWHFHQRLKGKKVADGAEMLGGCLFNPIFYFCLTVLIFSTINAFILQFAANRGEPGAPLFVSSIFIGLALMITHTILVYRYFSPPKHPPKSEFLRSPRSELIGDICIFVNMLFFQLIWNLLTLSGLPPITGIFDFAGRLFVLCFIALLIYFPPRMFYLAEDIRKRRTWIMIFLANAPVIVKVLFGTSSDLTW